MASTIANVAHGQHDRHLDQYSHYRGQSCAGAGAEQRDCGRNRKLEEVTRTDERSWRGNGVFNTQQSHQSVRQCGIKVDLNQNRDCD